MKGIFAGSLAVILEKSDLGYRIRTKHCEMLVDKSSVIEIPDAILSQYEPELLKIDTYIDQVRAKVDEIKQRYYSKQLELDGLIMNAGSRKVMLVHEMQMKAMGMKGE